MYAHVYIVYVLPMVYVVRGVGGLRHIISSGCTHVVLHECVQKGVFVSWHSHRSIEGHDRHGNGNHGTGIRTFTYSYSCVFCAKYLYQRATRHNDDDNDDGNISTTPQCEIWMGKKQSSGRRPKHDYTRARTMLTVFCISMYLCLYISMQQFGWIRSVSECERAYKPT